MTKPTDQEDPYTLAAITRAYLAGRLDWATYHALEQALETLQRRGAPDKQER